MARPADIIEYYANLLILQYIKKPKATATVKAFVAPLVMDFMPLAVQEAFNVNTAIGVQLDVIGKYVGASRRGNTFDGPVTLDDESYRTLIKLVIIKNNSGSSLATIQSLLAANFPGLILVSDNQTMGLNYLIIETLGTPELLEILVEGGYLPKPMGVQVSAVIVPAHLNPFFGFRTYTAPAVNASPFNNYALYQLTYPWFTYAGVL